MSSIKCVLVGDIKVGKTSLLVRFTSESFLDAYRPTVYDNTGVDVFMDGTQISLGLWDTSGNDSFTGIRPLSYQQADVVLICYSVGNPLSYLNVKNKWMPEVRYYLPNTPVVVVATQTDYRAMGTSRTITTVDGRKLAKDIDAQSYMECSALHNRGVQEVFERAVRTAFSHINKQSRRRIRDFIPLNRCVIT
ncbi:rho-related GTP-binding protein RhoH [Callorhinchus milii]|uniref:Rho-related GTP-binding protein RhoH n=1 Tax=Callorhinchus milii TaxID=7868 RepID=V9KTN2_CALMI|nr:rho-related GTP-binding protein RhoH [Callorhinchus milii]XP_007887326.1 rho-related GTP-binding protein RhoH [Callorhinchus milii]XP_007887327.1 rho-related GTP-binding protein RhoH [Callorhinchus milii]XP_007887328.1 rho-related GTP-binding protein RhoH [Callorhinchus milii]XP_007887329.1 rho-related GTP-binding protein RhoH [Callorhinchus milii]|eukprot:gi/632944120/ref/XP_007887325.1/ PREDICTED: rho-related GTP-binding protein RhoH [Callorhinchus milii]